MKKQEWNEGLDHLDPELVEEYVEQKDFLSKKKLRRDLWIRVGALAACLAVIVSTIILPISKANTPIIKPYIPNGKPWTPVIKSDVKTTTFSADAIAEMMTYYIPMSATSRYTKVYSKSQQYLNILPLPNAKYLPIYSLNSIESSESQFQDFINKYLDTATNLLNISTKDYQIRTLTNLYGITYYSTNITDGNHAIGFDGNNNHFYPSYLLFNLYSPYPNDKRLKLNGNFVSILESDTDEQIKEKLTSAIAYVCNTFGKNYDSIKIDRGYSSKQLDYINVFLYSLEETILPSNFAEYPISSESILLTFNPELQPGTGYNWGGTKDEAFLTDIYYYEMAGTQNDCYSVTEKSKMISLEKAEKLLEKGYVFGGHSCPICMAEQPEVDFNDYTYVNLEYLFDYISKIYVPFYAFYKYIGETEHGIGTYAKTYVPAVEVSGLENYFRMQESKH